VARQMLPTAAPLNSCLEASKCAWGWLAPKLHKSPVLEPYCRNSVRQRDRDFYSTHFDTRAGHNANLSALDEENEWLFGLVLRLQQKEEKWALNGSFKA